MRQLLSAAGLLCALLTTPAFAQVRVDVSTPPAPEITVQPRWQWMSDERVYVTTDPNVDYDMFRYGQWYYVYTDPYWYRSSSWNGPYESIGESQVPRVLFYLPENRYQWHTRRPVLGAYNDNTYNDNSYNHGDYDRDRYGNNTSSQGPMIESRPTWRWVPEQHVYVAVNPDRNYEMFRAGNSYYVNQNGMWYRSSRWSGPFTTVEESYIPYDVLTVARTRGVVRAYTNGYNGMMTSNVMTPAPRHRPHWRYLSDQRVFVAVNGDRDYDMFRVGGWYYVRDNSNWFRARRWDGPYTLVEERDVPRPVYYEASNRDWDTHRRHHHDRDRD